MAVAGEVEEDRPLLSRLVGLPCGLERPVDRVRGLGRRDDPLARRKEDGRSEHIALDVGLRSDQLVLHKLRDQRRDAVVAEAARVDRSRHEVVPERVHRNERRQLARVPEVVCEQTSRKRWTRRGLARKHVDLAASDLLTNERERKPGEVRAATDAADDDVGEGAGLFHLRDRLLADHRLMQEHVIEHAAERVRGVVALRRVLDGLRDRNP